MLGGWGKQAREGHGGLTKDDVAKSLSGSLLGTLSCGWSMMSSSDP